MKTNPGMLKECMRELHDINLSPNPKEKIVRKKYARDDFQAVSKIPVRGKFILSCVFGVWKVLISKCLCRFVLVLSFLYC